LIVLPIRLFIAQPFIVSGASMDPTFETGEYLIVDQLSYKIDNPKRGEVVIFKYPKDETKYFIKRIIGFPEKLLNLMAPKSSSKTKIILKDLH
jgi:signal peptidase I